MSAEFQATSSKFERAITDAALEKVAVMDARYRALVAAASVLALPYPRGEYRVCPECTATWVENEPPHLPGCRFGELRRALDALDAPVAQLAEAAGLEPAQSESESPQAHK